MLLGRNRVRIVLWHALHHVHLFDIELKPTLGPLVRAHLAGDDDARLLR